jgi:hypothetical protein
MPSFLAALLGDVRKSASSGSDLSDGLEYYLYVTSAFFFIAPELAADAYVRLFAKSVVRLKTAEGTEQVNPKMAKSVLAIGIVQGALAVLICVAANILKAEYPCCSESRYCGAYVKLLWFWTVNSGCPDWVIGAVWLRGKWIQCNPA